MTAAAAPAGRFERVIALVRPSPASTVLFFAAIALAAATVATRIGAVPDQWLWNADLPKIDYPLASFFHDALAAGRLPLWNDQLGLGFPLYAEGQIGAFYPPNWLFFQLPPLAALDLTRVLHLTLAGVGTGLIALRLTGSRLASLGALLVAVLGGAIGTKLEWHNLVAAYGWLPWVLLPFVGRAAPSSRALVAGGIAWGIQALAGHPNTWLLTGLTALVLLVATTPRWTSLARCLVFGLLGVAVGAVQLVPTLVLTSLSVRSSSLSTTDLFASAATPFDLLGLGFANAFALPGSDGAWDLYRVWYPDGIFALLEAGAYVGLPVVALAAVGAGSRRARPLLVALAVLLAIPIVAAFQPAWWAAVPILNALRSPVRAYVPASLLIGVIASLGVARVSLPAGTGARFRTKRWLVAAAAVGLLVVAWTATVAIILMAPSTFQELIAISSSFLDRGNLPEIQSRALAALTNPLPLVPELVLGGLVVGLLAAVTRPAWAERRRSARLGLMVVAALPLLAFGHAPNSTAPVESFSSAGTEFVKAARATGAHRLLTLGEPGWYEGMPDQLAAAGVPDIRMFSSLDLAASDRLLAELRAADASPELRRAVGVDVIVTFGDTLTCPGAVIAEDGPTRATFCRDALALRPPYWLPRDRAEVGAAASSLPWAPPEAEVRVDSLAGSTVAGSVIVDRPGLLEAQVDAPGEGWLWIDRAWWPAWEVTVDGTVVSPARAMGGLLVPVTAGTHSLRASLVPREALIGLGVGALAVLLALGSLAAARRRGRGRGVAPADVARRSR